MSLSRDQLLGLLKRMAAGESLTAPETSDAVASMMAGEVSEIHTASFLSLLAFRGPSPAELTGAAQAMRHAMTHVQAPNNAVDVCGTGGDDSGTLNVSTASAFVVAGCGVPVAKHGNRAMSSRTGAADVLEALGVPINNSAITACEKLRDPGFTFLFAPAFHPAMKNVAPVRKELGFRTIFNLLGPICNPAGVKRQLLGIFSDKWLLPIAEVLRDLGAERAWVVHGSGGLDEMSTLGPTRVAMLSDREIALREITPEEAGLPRATLTALKGGTAEQNARAILQLLDGAPGAFRDIVLLNSGAALVVAGVVRHLREGIGAAAEAIDSGRAMSVLQQSRCGP